MYDGFHPRQLGDLSEEALAVLATIYQVVEVSGQWPRQISLVSTPMLPKPKGGFRPIGLLSGADRCWAKARRDLTDVWEAAHQRAFLSAAKGNGSLETMWRMAARQEAGTSDGDQAGVVADDLSAFFETINREALMREAEALGFPIPILRGALAAYAAARMITLQGRVSREVYPTVGVIAGRSLSMALTKVFYLRALDTLVSKLPPNVLLDVHVDDVTLSSIGTPRDVVRSLARARADMITIVTELGCRIAPDKTAVTGTTRKSPSPSLAPSASTRRRPTTLASSAWIARRARPGRRSARHPRGRRGCGPHWREGSGWRGYGRPSAVRQVTSSGREFDQQRRTTLLSGGCPTPNACASAGSPPRR